MLGAVLNVDAGFLNEGAGNWNGGLVPHLSWWRCKSSVRDPFCTLLASILVIIKPMGTLVIGSWKLCCGHCDSCFLPRPPHPETNRVRRRGPLCSNRDVRDVSYCTCQKYAVLPSAVSGVLVCCAGRGVGSRSHCLVHVIIDGASGIGFTAAEALAAKHATFIPGGRGTSGKHEGVCVRSGSLELFVCPQFCSPIDPTSLRVDVFPCNAGIETSPGLLLFNKKAGFEIIVQMNYLSHLLLADNASPLLYHSNGRMAFTTCRMSVSAWGEYRLNCTCCRDSAGSVVQPSGAFFGNIDACCLHECEVKCDHKELLSLLAQVTTEMWVIFPTSHDA